MATITRGAAEKSERLLVNNAIKKINTNDLKLKLADLIKEKMELTTKVVNLEAKISTFGVDYEIRIKELQDKIEAIRKTNMLVGGVTDKATKQKVILQLRARNYSKEKIRGFIDTNAIDGISDDLINYTINNLKSLEPTLEAYYLEQSLAFAKTINIDGEIIKQGSIDILLENKDQLDRALEHVDVNDTQTLMRLIELKNAVADKMIKFSGNLVEENKVVMNSDVSDIQENLKKQGERIMKFGFNSNLKIV